MAGPNVKCVVDTCTHYLPGELCGAYNIDIMHEEEGHMSESWTKLCVKRLVTELELHRC